MYSTYPYKSGDKGTVFGPPKMSTTRKQAARDRSDLCLEVSASTRSWSGAITYTPAGTT